MKRRLGWILWVVLSLVGYVLLVHISRSDTFPLLTVWGFLFALYGLAISFKADRDAFPLLCSAAVVFRLIGMTTLPTLSDDVYRFIWDGRLLAHGYNPFLYLPTGIIGTEIATQSGLTESLLQKLNSPDYYTVYPPILQAWFWVVSMLTSSEVGAVLGLRFPIFLGEIASLWLLYQLLKEYKDVEVAKKGTLLYALNPLIIVELTANIHYEGLTICFLLAGLYYFQKSKTNASAVFLGLAAGVKLLPLIFLPALLDRKQLLESFRYYLIVGAILLVPFAFFFDSVVIERFSTSLDLYFRRFEFNASIYYGLREIGTFILGYNPIATIGPLLAVVSLSLILFFSWTNRLTLSLPERWLWVLTTYLLCATTVHPWYVIPLVALSVLTRFRFPLLWSAFLILTYTAYGNVPFQENGWIVTLEYLAVGGFMAWELRSNIR